MSDYCERFCYQYRQIDALTEAVGGEQGSALYGDARERVLAQLALARAAFSNLAGHCQGLQWDIANRAHCPLDGDLNGIIGMIAATNAEPRVVFNPEDKPAQQ